MASAERVRLQAPDQLTDLTLPGNLSSPSSCEPNLATVLQCQGQWLGRLGTRKDCLNQRVTLIAPVSAERQQPFLLVTAPGWQLGFADHIGPPIAAGAILSKRHQHIALAQAQIATGQR